MQCQATLMNSRIEVSQNIVAILGSETSSEFRLNRIRESLSLDKSSDVCAREIYFLKLRKDSSYVSVEDYKQLSDLLVGSDTQDIKDKSFFLLTPRICLLYTSPSPRDATLSRMPSSA